MPTRGRIDTGPHAGMNEAEAEAFDTGHALGQIRGAVIGVVGSWVSVALLKFLGYL